MSGRPEKGSKPETGFDHRRNCYEGGWSSRCSRRQRPRRVAPCGGVVYFRAAVRLRRLFVPGRIGLPRRKIRPRRGVLGPDRQRHPRGFLRAVEAHEPREKICAMPLKHRQEGFWEGDGRCVHGVVNSRAVLKNRSGEAATMSQIVTDGDRVEVWADENVEAALSAASARELAFGLLYVRRPGAGIGRLLAPVPQVGGLFEKAGCNVRIGARHRKLQQCRGLLREILSTRQHPSPVARNVVLQNAFYRRQPVPTSVDNAITTTPEPTTRADAIPFRRIRETARGTESRPGGHQLVTGVNRRPAAFRFSCE